MCEEYNASSLIENWHVGEGKLDLQFRVGRLWEHEIFVVR